MRREFPQEKCKITMYGFPRPVIPNDVQWNHHRAPHHPQWRPHARLGPRALFRPRNHGFHNHRSPNPAMQGGSEEYWCETCDRGFPTEDLLNNHKLQHQVSTIYILNLQYTVVGSLTKIMMHKLRQAALVATTDYQNHSISQ